MSESSAQEQGPADVAELQLIDALLSSMSEQAADDRNTRIRRVMDAIEESPTVSGKRSPSRVWQSLVAVAVCLMVSCTVFLLQFSGESRASDVLQEVAAVSLERIDRVYSLRRVVSTSSKPDQREGRLYLRGRAGFVIVCGGVVLGRSGDEFWFVPQEGPVVVAEDFGWMVGTSEHEKLELELLHVLAIDSRSLPLVQLSSVVELMRHDYDVAIDDRMRHGRRVDLLVGTLKNQSRDFPDTIRLWSDGDSQVIERAELEWTRPHEQSPANMVILELVATERVGADWYEHEAHHPSGQPLHHISSGS